MSMAEMNVPGPRFAEKNKLSLNTDPYTFVWLLWYYHIRCTNKNWEGNSIMHFSVLKNRSKLVEEARDILIINAIILNSVLKRIYENSLIWLKRDCFSQYLYVRYFMFLVLVHHERIIYSIILICFFNLIFIFYLSFISIAEDDL